MKLSITHKKTKKDFTIQLVWILTALCIITATTIITVLQFAGSKNIDSFQTCKDAGGIIAESYPEQCRVDGKMFINDTQSVQPDDEVSEYIGLTEQQAFDKADKESKARRVVERDSKPLPATMDFSPGRLNFYVKDGKVYKVEIENNHR